MCAGLKDTVVEEGEPGTLRLSLNDKCWGGDKRDKKQTRKKKQQSESKKETERSNRSLALVYLFW